MSSDPHRGTESGPDAISSMLDVFSDPLRRRVLHHLERAEGAVAVGELARRVGESERTLRRNHVTPLADFGLLSYDRGVDAVRIADDATVTIRPPDAP